MTATTTPLFVSSDLELNRYYTTYMFVVDNWAVSAVEVAEAISAMPKRDLKKVGGSMEPKEATAILKRLEKVALTASTHVNGERTLTWQSYFDVNNGESREEAEATFSERVAVAPEGTAVRRGRAPGGRGATGPRYTAEQIAEGIELRRSGASWLKVAEAMGVKSQVYFSNVLRAHNGGIDPKGQPAPEPVAAEETPKKRRTVRRSAAKKA